MEAHKIAKEKILMSQIKHIQTKKVKKSSKGLLRKKTMKSQKIKDKKLSKMNILNQREE